MSDHAFLAPSSAGVWGPGGCPASPRMAQAFPEDGETQEAREGEAAHWWMAEAVEGREWPEGSQAPNGVPTTMEMAECAERMVSDIRALLPDMMVSHVLEERVHMPQIHPTLNWGRADFGAINVNTRTLYAWDYKFGHGYVDVFENWQLVDYMVGIANHFGVTITPEWTIDMRIYQPRSFHEDGPVKRVTVSGARFLELQAMLAAAAHEAAQPDAPMRTGPQCTYCPARHACPALRKVGGLAVDMSLRGVPSVLTAANAGLALRTIRTARERLEDLETGLEAQIMAAIRKGEAATGWTLEQGYGREKWTQPVADVIALGVALGHDLAKPQEAITPAQARKKGIDDAVISAYSEKPKGEMKLRPLDEKSIRKAFQ
mgnify:FL=1